MVNKKESKTLIANARQMRNQRNSKHKCHKHYYGEISPLIMGLKFCDEST